MFRRLKGIRESSREGSQEKEQPGKELARAEKELEEARKALAEADDLITQQRLRITQLLEGVEVPRGVRAENIVWIFGAARTGSTWLSRMMGELPGCEVWNEPLVGSLFGDFYYDRAGKRIGKRGKHHILGDGYRESWMPSIRSFVLKEAAARFPRLGEAGYLVIKEPNGSFGAPLLSEALPESRLILLMRDPRDAVASGLDARREGGFQHREEDERTILASEDPDAFVEERASQHLRKMTKAQEAHTKHQGPKAIVRYEDLRADPFKTLVGMYLALGMPRRERKLRGAIEKHDWENVSEKGSGKMRRKATPGGWREDLTPEQARIVERICAAHLKEFYP